MPSFLRIVFQRQFTDLGMQRLHVDRWLCRRAATRTEHIGSSALKLRLPRGNLIRVNVELFGKLRQCPIALDGGKCGAADVFGPGGGSAAKPAALRALPQPE